MGAGGAQEKKRQQAGAGKADNAGRLDDVASSWGSLPSDPEQPAWGRCFHHGYLSVPEEHLKPSPSSVGKRLLMGALEPLRGQKVGGRPGYVAWAGRKTL